MRLSFSRPVAVGLMAAFVGLGGGGGGGARALAQPKGASGRSAEVGDKGMDKQMDWENKVMGEDSAKRADMKKIAAAQKLADQARKHPAPEPAPKVKDPSKEGVRAKQEASIGLPIASDDDAAHRAKKMSAPKRAAAPGSADDELGALVASSLASDKSPRHAPPADASAADLTRARAVKGSKHAKAAPRPASNSLDDLLSGQKN